MLGSKALSGLLRCCPLLFLYFFALHLYRFYISFADGRMILL